MISSNGGGVKGSVQPFSGQTSLLIHPSLDSQVDAELYSLSTVPRSLKKWLSYMTDCVHLHAVRLGKRPVLLCQTSLSNAFTSSRFSLV